MIIIGDALGELRKLSSESVDCCVTSPPYWGLRDYGIDGQIGLEETPKAFVEKLSGVFSEVHRVLKPSGTLWLNLGDSYCNSGRGGNSKAITGRGKDASAFQKGKTPIGLKPKDLVGIPWRVAFALQDDGWYLRSDIIWAKPNPMPESVTDRPTKAHEYIFLLAKNEKYHYDAEAIRQPLTETSVERLAKPYNQKASGYRDVNGAPDGDRSHLLAKGANKRTVWTITTKCYKGAHFATFPPDLIEPCIKAGCPEYGVVLDPFFGAGTTGLVATQLRRRFIGIELNPEYADIARERIGLEATV